MKSGDRVMVVVMLNVGGLIKRERKFCQLTNVVVLEVVVVVIMESGSAKQFFNVCIFMFQRLKF